MVVESPMSVDEIIMICVVIIVNDMRGTIKQEAVCPVACLVYTFTFVATYVCVCWFPKAMVYTMHTVLCPSDMSYNNYQAVTFVRLRASRTDICIIMLIIYRYCVTRHGKNLHKIGAFEW